MRFCTAPLSVPTLQPQRDRTMVAAAPKICGWVTENNDTEFCEIHERQRNRQTNQKLSKPEARYEPFEAGPPESWPINQSTNQENPEMARTAKNPQLPSMQDQTDEALTRAAVNYAKANKAFTLKRQLLSEAKQILFDLMKSKGKEIYRDISEDVVVEILHGKDRLTVKAISEDAAPDDSESDDVGV